MKNNKLKSYSLVIPIFNNEKTALTQLNSCLEILKKTSMPFEIILINDASTDKTASAIDEFKKRTSKITLITHKKNLGIAKSLKELYEKAKNDYIILFSVDGGWSPLDITKLISKQAKSNAEIVIGKRTSKKYTLLRHIVSLSYNFLTLLLFGVRTYDAGSIKLFSKKLYRNIDIKSKTIYFEAEFIIKSKRSGAIITTTPISHKATSRKQKSGVNISTVLDSLTDMIKLRLEL